MCKDADFELLFGQSVPVPPVPVPTNKFYKVITFALWVRAVPNGTIVGYKWRGSIVEVTEIVDGWAHLKEGCWMSADPRYIVEFVQHAEHA